MRTLESISITILLILVFALPAYTDKRTENIDIILALDKSLSMSEDHKIDAVKNYFNSWLMDEVLIPGDYLVVIAFYGKTSVVISQTVKNTEEKQKVKDIISQIRANGRFTDIGNALDVMKDQMAKYGSDGRKKFVLMMTDGIQEAPPNSKYFSQKGKFNYEFLENTKTIQKQGWKIEILGLGTETEVKELAEQLQGTYVELKDDLSVENLKSRTENLLGTISLIDGARVSPIGIGGSGSIQLNLKSEGYSRDVQISLSGIEARLPSRTAANLLASPPFQTKVSASGKTVVNIPVVFPADLTPGTFDCTLVFSFLSGERFSPSEIPVKFRVMGPVENYWWLGIIGILALSALAAVVVFFIRRLASGGPQRFLLLIDEEPLADTPITMNAGGEIFLNESDNAFILIPKRNARSLARFRMKEGALGFDVLKSERFPKTDGSAEAVIGQSFIVRTEHGEKKDLRIVEATARKSKAVQTPKTIQKPPAVRVSKPSAPTRTHAAKPLAAKKTPKAIRGKPKKRKG